jgi:hypothetical protein
MSVINHYESVDVISFTHEHPVLIEVLLLPSNRNLQ